MLKYITDCPDGYCTLTREQTKRVVHKNKDQIVCLEHCGSVVQRLNECRDCGEEYYIGKSGRAGFMCAPCAKKDNAKRRKARRIEKESKIVPVPEEVPSSIWSIDNRGDYCILLSSCITLNQVDCESCETMIPIFRGVDPGMHKQIDNRQ